MKSAPDVVFVIADLGPGGAQRVMVTIAGELVRRGYRVTVVTYADESGDHYALPEGVLREILGGHDASASLIGAVFLNARRVWRLRRALRRIQPPVVVSFIGVTNIIAVLASALAPWRLVISERNDPARQNLGRPWDGLRRMVYRYADTVTANSAGALQSLGKFVPKRKLALVRNPVNTAHFQPGEGPRETTVLAVGRLVPQKAFDILIRAFSNLSRNLAGWRLLIAGDGPLAGPLKSLTEELGANDRIEFLGVVPDCRGLYRRAAIFAMPSRFEGTPNALLEAMACGCAVIISDTSGGALEIVEHGKSGHVVPVDDVAGLSAAILRLANDEPSRTSLGAAAIKTATSCETGVVVENWQKILGLPPARA